MSASFPPTKIPLTIAFPFAILSFVYAGQARSNILICINPPPAQIIHGIEQPKLPLKCAKRTRRYNEFGSNS